MGELNPGATATVGAGPATTPMRRVAAACLVGSAIEFYDFLIYGTAAALVFPTVFFPRLSPTVAMIASMGTFATAFLSRPLGAAVFGYFGDRLGRKKTLVATLLIMAVSTVIGGPGSQHRRHRHGGPADPGRAAAAAGVRRRRGMGGVGAAERRVRAARQTRPLRHVHPARRRYRRGAEQPDLPRRELHHRREQPRVPAVGMAHPVPDQRGADRIRAVCPAQHRRDPGLRRGEGPPPGAQGAARRGAAPAAPRDRSGRRQHAERVRLRLHGQHLPHHVRPLPPGLYAQLHLVRRRAGRIGEHLVRRALGHPVRSGRAPPHDAGGVGRVRAVGVCGDAVDEHRQTRPVRGRRRRHVRHRRDRLRTHRGLHPGTVRHPLPLQRIGAGA